MKIWCYGVKWDFWGFGGFLEVWGVFGSEPGRRVNQGLTP